MSCMHHFGHPFDCMVINNVSRDYMRLPVAGEQSRKPFKSRV